MPLSAVVHSLPGRAVSSVAAPGAAAYLERANVVGAGPPLIQASVPLGFSSSIYSVIPAGRSSRSVTDYRL